MFSTLLLLSNPSQAETRTSLPLGGPAWVFTLPQWNLQEGPEKAAHSKVSLLDYVGLRPSKPSQALVLCFFRQSDGETVIKSLNSISRQYQSQNVRVLAIDMDSAGDMAREEWLRTQKPSYPVLRDDYQIVSSRYGVENTPLFYILDNQGMVFAMGMPAATEIGPTVVDELESLLRLRR